MSTLTHKNTINKLLTNVEPQTIPFLNHHYKCRTRNNFCSPQLYLSSLHNRNLSSSYKRNHSSRFFNECVILVSFVEALNSLTTLLFFTFDFNILRHRSIYLHQTHFAHQITRLNCTYVLRYLQLTKISLPRKKI